MRYLEQGAFLLEFRRHDLRFMSLNRLIAGTLPRLRQCSGRRICARHLRISGCAKNQEIASETAPRTDESFRELFERSKFAAIVDPVGQEVEGEVLAMVGEKMYVDFGCKFHAVVPVPDQAESGSYEKGSRVVVRVLDLEMTDHFIGDHRDTSLLEAEAELVGKL